MRQDSNWISRNLGEKGDKIQNRYKYRNHPQNASYGVDFCILKVAYFENLTADKQNILGLCQQWTNETNTKRLFVGGVFL